MKPAKLEPRASEPSTTAAMRRGTALHDLLWLIQDPKVQLTLIQALRHCQGMGFALPLADSEIDALCKRLGDPQ